MYKYYQVKMPCIPAVAPARLREGGTWDVYSSTSEEKPALFLCGKELYNTTERGHFMSSRLAIDKALRVSDVAKTIPWVHRPLARTNDYDYDVLQSK